MPKTLRNALIWMVMLAIPVQGIAAATMLTCGPSHQRMINGAVTAASHDHGTALHDGHAHQHAQHAQGHGQDHQHDMHAADARDDTAATPAAGDSAQAQIVPVVSDFDQSAKLTCSACASCCSAAALVSSAAPAPAPAAGIALLIPAPVSTISFITDGPSRPPRTHLA